MSGSNIGIAGLDAPEEIGRGGFGVVYRARQAAFQRTVAVKVLSLIGAEDARSRFERERQTIGALSGHPNVVTVHESGYADDGTPYILMEYLAQGSLTQRLRERPYDPREAVAIAIKVAGALEAAHGLGILHRDVKPENVLLSSYDEPKLGDFGIAMLASSESTRSGSLTASVAHAAPELFDGARASVATDVYALGSTLFTLLARTPAFRVGHGDSLVGVIGRITREPIPDLRAINVPDPIARVVERAMAKQPGERQPTAAAFAEELQAAQRELGDEVTPFVAGSPEDRAIEWATSSVVLDDVVPADGAVAPAVVDAEVASGEGRRRGRRTAAVLLPLLLIAGIAAALVATLGGDDGGDESALAAASKSKRTTTVAPTTTPTTVAETTTVPVPASVALVEPVTTPTTRRTSGGASGNTNSGTAPPVVAQQSPTTAAPVVTAAPTTPAPTSPPVPAPTVSLSGPSTVYDYGGDGNGDYQFYATVTNTVSGIWTLPGVIMNNPNYQPGDWFNWNPGCNDQGKWFTLTLTVFNSAGQSNSASKDIYVGYGCL